jgi:hypothetical protein
VETSHISAKMARMKKKQAQLSTIMSVATRAIATARSNHT